MANRKVGLSIQIENAKSVSDLEQVIKDINSELKQVDVNSEAFAEISAQSKKATSSLNDVKDELKVISNEKQIDSVAKIGGAMAAGMSVATIAASKMGDQTEESILKAIKTAQELSVVVSSLKPIMEGISSGNRKAFGEFVKGFKESSLGATLFGNTTRTAIASTGIGLLVIAIGLLIANWEAVTKAVIDFGNSIPFVKKIIDGISELVEKVGSLSNLFNGIKAFIVGAFTSGKSAVDEFNKAIEKGKVIEALEKQAELIATQNEERERAIKILEAQGKKELEILGIKKEAAQSELANLEALKKAGAELTKDQEKRIKDLQLEVQILEINSKKAIEAAKRAAWEKQNAEAQRLLNIKDLDDAYNREQNEKQLVNEKELQDELLDLFKERKQKEVTENIQIEEDAAEERFNVQLVSKNRELAILKSVQDTKRISETNLQRELRDEQIKYLEDVKNRTEEQEQLLNELKLEKFKEFIEQVTPYIQELANGLNMVSDAITQALTRQLDSLKLELDIVNTQFQESVSNRMALEAQLADAEGVRREMILAGIEAERQKENQLAKERKKIQNEQIKATNKLNLTNWVNSIAQSIISTALASAAALPNVPLSIIVGALGAISTGIIIGNKPNVIPTLASGGFFEGYTGPGGARDETGERSVGLAKLHGNEWVAPRWMVEDSGTGSIIQQLEAIRSGIPSFATGGFTAPSLTPNLSESGLSAGNLKQIMENANLYVSVVEVRDKLTNVNVIESRSSLAA